MMSAYRKVKRATGLTLVFVLLMIRWSLMLVGTLIGGAWRALVIGFKIGYIICDSLGTELQYVNDISKYIRQEQGEGEGEGEGE